MRTYFWLRSLLIALGILAFSAGAFAQVSVGISVAFAPPELPVYEQPLCPAEGYIWTPGYWAWDGDDYFWVPGTWVLAPEIGYFWTPPYWGWGGSGFVFYEGYWGPVVGFYGGINYGYGYFGHGYEGGRWDNGHFLYNREVNNVNVTVIHNVYNTRIINRNETRISYNGGQGGINARPTSQEEAAARERHVLPVAAQTQHIQAARGNPQFRASENHGKPPVAATPKPAAFNERGVTPATSAAHYNPPPRTTNNAPNSNAPRPNPVVHPNDLPPHERPTSPNTGNPKTDQKYQQEQEKFYQKQQQEHQKLQQKQEQEHQRQAKQQADEAKKQQMEQRHQQQTQQMEQKHVQQQQKMTQRQQPPSHQSPPPPHEPAPHEAPPKHNP